MTYYILITLCIIILIAYIFEITGKYSKIPGVILLMCFGLLLRYFSTNLGISIPDLSILLPIMGTLGLILIVLEGSMDLTLSSEKKQLVFKSLVSAVFLFLLQLILLSGVLIYYFHIPFKTALINSIPFGIISSAVAIPSSVNLKKGDREFIVYESSISDIVGILLFDFVVFNHLPLGQGILFFSFEVIVTIIFSVIISGALAYMLHKIGHHVKYVIILTVVILIFTVAKLILWPSLIVVLIFGLILNNTHFFQTKFILRHIDFHEFNLNLKSFKQITGELTFLVRSFFFLIFGFYTSTSELLNLKNLGYSISICFSIYLFRALFYKYILRKSLTPLLFFAPRGLITILLFLSIPAELKLPFMGEGLITQIIFISILFMAIGNILTVRRKEKVLSETDKPEVVI